MNSIDYLESPLGLLRIQASEKGITHILFCEQRTQEIQTGSLLQQCKSQLQAYFSGELRTFQLPLDWHGTSFQQRVWTQLTTIPYGNTATYLDVARSVQSPKAVRAVGGANARNPISIVVPCHRVIGTQGRLTGYAGGIARKQWLLEHEGVLQQKPLELHSSSCSSLGHA